MKRSCPDEMRWVSVGGCDVLESEPQNVPRAEDEAEVPNREEGWREIRGKSIYSSHCYILDWLVYYAIIIYSVTINNEPFKGTNFNEKRGRNLTFLGWKMLRPIMKMTNSASQIFGPQNVRYLSPFSLKLEPLKGLFVFGSFLQCLLFIVWIFSYLIPSFGNFTLKSNHTMWTLPSKSLLCKPMSPQFDHIAAYHTTPAFDSLPSLTVM